MEYEIDSIDAMLEFGKKVGLCLEGGEFLELVGDVGAGKTTFTKGVAAGMGIEETIQSPTFTISRTYDSPSNRRLVHYDFYRLLDAGIMRDELAEVAEEPATSVVVEWAEAVRDVIPRDHMRIEFISIADEARRLHVMAKGERSTGLLERLKT